MELVRANGTGHLENWRRFPLLLSSMEFRLACLTELDHRSPPHILRRLPHPSWSKNRNDAPGEVQNLDIWAFTYYSGVRLWKREDEQVALVSAPRASSANLPAQAWMFSVRARRVRNAQAPPPTRALDEYVFDRLSGQTYEWAAGNLRPPILRRLTIPISEGPRLFAPTIE
jgi:hypothetical protein